jgi:hypothetical protein
MKKDESRYEMLLKAIRLKSLDAVKIMLDTTFKYCCYDFKNLLDCAIEQESAEIIREILKFHKKRLTNAEIVEINQRKTTPEISKVFEDFFQTLEDGKESEVKKIKKNN